MPTKIRVDKFWYLEFTLLIVYSISLDSIISQSENNNFCGVLLLNRDSLIVLNNTVPSYLVILLLLILLLISSEVLSIHPSIILPTVYF